MTRERLVGMVWRVATRQYRTTGLHNYDTFSTPLPTYNKTWAFAIAESLYSKNATCSNRSARVWSPFVHQHVSRTSTAAAQVTKTPEEKDSAPKPETPESKQESKVEMENSAYWGMVPKVPAKSTERDGSPWKWSCFKPQNTHAADLNIDLDKHHPRETWTDFFAYHIVRMFRWPTDIFFQKRYGCRAMMLETVAAVPGMVGGLLLHCKSLRRFEHSGGWIKALLEEAENERMHLMTFMEVAEPKWYERAIVFAVQGGWFNLYFLIYVLNPKLAHRITGYLEEEAIWSYNHFLAELDKGNISNGPAPAIAKDYWRLPEDATIRDVVIAVRSDEAHHRDVNHFAAVLFGALHTCSFNRHTVVCTSLEIGGGPDVNTNGIIHVQDVLQQGKQLREAPPPLGY